MVAMDRGHHSTWTVREAWCHAYAMARMDISRERITEEHGRLLAGWAIEAAHVRLPDPLTYRLRSPWRSSGLSGQYLRSLQSGYIMAFDDSRTYRKVYGQYAPR